MITPRTYVRQARSPHPMHVAQLVHPTPVPVNPEVRKPCAMRHVSPPPLIPPAKCRVHPQHLPQNKTYRAPSSVPPFTDTPPSHPSSPSSGSAYSPPRAAVPRRRLYSLRPSSRDTSSTPHTHCTRELRPTATTPSRLSALRRICTRRSSRRYPTCTRSGLWLRDLRRRA
jgi:hypothetical protein